VSDDKPVHGSTRVFTSEEIKECFELAPSLTKQQLADYFGCCFNTLARAMIRQPEFGEAYRKGKVLAIVEMAGSVQKRGIEGDVGAAKFWLSHQAGWTETKRTEVTGKDGDPIDIDMQWTIEVVE
jgi:hypothetical protein